MNPDSVPSIDHDWRQIWNDVVVPKKDELRAKSEARKKKFRIAETARKIILSKLGRWMPTANGRWIMLWPGEDAVVVVEGGIAGTSFLGTILATGASVVGRIYGQEDGSILIKREFQDGKMTIVSPDEHGKFDQDEVCRAFIEEFREVATRA